MEVIIDGTLNFWEVFPSFKSIEPFKEFYDNNEDKESSSLMWFLVYVYHLESPFYGMGENAKIEMAGDSLLGSKKYYNKNKEQIDFLAKSYCETVDSVADRQLRVWDAKMNEKTRFLESIVYDVSSWEMIDKMLKANKDLFLIEKQIRLEREKEKGGTKKGGGIPSLTDSGEI